VVRCHSDIEEEVEIEVRSQRMEVFVEECSTPLAVGHTYPVHLSLVVLDDDELQIGGDGPDFIKPLGGGRYRVRGTLRNHATLESCDLLFDVSELVDEVTPGAVVEISADRVSASFLDG